MTVFELAEILREVNPLARVAIMARESEADHAEEIVAVATPRQVWVRRGCSDTDRKTRAPHLCTRDCGDDVGDHECAKPAPGHVSIVILSADEDFLFKATVKNLTVG